MSQKYTNIITINIKVLKVTNDVTTDYNFTSNNTIFYNLIFVQKKYTTVIDATLIDTTSPS